MKSFVQLVLVEKWNLRAIEVFAKTNEAIDKVDQAATAAASAAVNHGGGGGALAKRRGFSSSS